MLRRLAAAVALFIAPAIAAAGEAVHFLSLDGITNLPGVLSLPAAQRPDDGLPAAIFLHGCSGLRFHGDIIPTYSAWTDHLNAAGYAVLMIDSATPRGFRATCGPGEARTTMFRDRPKDAYAALRFLQAQPEIDETNVALIGWSQGGGITLLSVVTNSIGRPSPPPADDFRAAVAFYPAACSDRFQSRPFTNVAPNTWSTDIPLLVLQGGADNWTKAAPCEQFINAAASRGEPVEITVYPGAHHAFDAPNLSLRQRLGSTTVDGLPPLIGTHPAARAAALTDVVEFLDRHTATD